ncbi:dihydrodipicolinate synthase family protein [candidate division KSB1 bacterium]|nr:dihydrodipicolinate synthase family protein [candidate division KSB1 bacterium]RQW04220.1 MAG: dihydrodipicolinate synthase family protein [candidate division KSB1 bacterium]
MNNIFPDGIWPTMITPFTAANEIDYDALERMIEWYIEHKSDGLFAVCQSSEMWQLSLIERVQLSQFVVRKAAGRLPVIASGHIGESEAEQLDELERIANTGVQGLVLVTNRLAAINEDADQVKRSIETILRRLPQSMPLGLYECPYPYKRLFTPALLRFCEDTERFYFLKDTSCSVDDMRAKMGAITGRLKIYNANAATLDESYHVGVAGYSGVMANFHPHLYRWHFDHFDHASLIIKEVAEMLSIASLIERQFYPVNAKYHMRLEGIELGLFSRIASSHHFARAQQLEVEQLRSLVNRFIERLPNLEEK